MDFKPGVARTTQTTFSSRVEIEGDLTEREKTILLNSAHQCDVHKILTGDIGLTDQLVINGEVWEPEPSRHQG